MINRNQELGNLIVSFIKNKNDDDFNAFIQSITQEEIKTLLHTQHPLFGTPLVTAIYFNYAIAFNLLLNLEINLTGKLNGINHPGALVTAVRQDNLYMVDALLKANIDVNDSGAGNYVEPSALEEKYLDESCPFIRSGGAPIFELPIIIALQENCLKVLRRLLQEKTLDLTKNGTSNYSANDLISQSYPSPECLEIVKSLTRSASPTAAFTRLFPAAPTPASKETSATVEKSTKSYPRYDENS